MYRQLSYVELTSQIYNTVGGGRTEEDSIWRVDNII